MSYDVSLSYPDGVAQVPNHEEGGTYALGGTTDAWLNITYNYSRFFYNFLDQKKGLRWLYGKTGQETIERLESAIAIMGTFRSSDYWEPTMGNAGFALSILLSWARLHPEAVWEGD